MRQCSIEGREIICRNVSVTKEAYLVAWIALLSLFWAEMSNYH